MEENDKFDGKRWMFPCAKGKSDQAAIDILEFPAFSIEELSYHIAMLVNADFVTGKMSGSSETLLVSSLTWAGHEFLANIKNDDIWEKTKVRMHDLPGIALKAVAAIAQAEIMKKLGIN
jgi:hypothetical protein